MCPECTSFAPMNGTQVTTASVYIPPHRIWRRGIRAVLLTNVSDPEQLASLNKMGEKYNEVSAVRDRTRMQLQKCCSRRFSR